jgi:acetyl esterase
MTTDHPEIPDAATDSNIDRRVRPMLARLNEDPSPYWLLPEDQVKEVLQGLQDSAPRELGGVDVSEYDIDIDGIEVKIYVQRPSGITGNLPVILFIHGGVWIAGNFNNHQRFSRDLAVATGFAAVFVEYDSIPASVFPVQLQQSYAALQWIAQEGPKHGLDPSRIAVVGNSVGGNLAAALAMYTRDKGGPAITVQVLLYPATDSGLDTESYRKYATGRFLPREFMKFGWDTYAPDEETRKNPYAAPLQASAEQLTGLPPAIVIVPENDILRDEGIAYARKLDAAGVDVITIEYIGLIHDFNLLNPIQDVPSVKASFRHVAADLRYFLQ